VVILDLVEAVQPLAEGMSARLPIASAEELDLVRSWCERSANTLVGARDGWVEVRRGRTLATAAHLTRPVEARLWLYTNFDCNLACDYCCVRSSPAVDRRALGLATIRRLVDEARHTSVREIFLTGGEPFILPDIGEIVASCVAAFPTTLLTNGMLFSGRRLETLKAMPRQNFALQISLDSPEPDGHDRHRGKGAWLRALGGIQTARHLGFRVRVAATLTEGGRSEGEMRRFLDDLGIPTADQIVRPVARQGVAETGVVLTRESLIPEVTITAEGVFWHPVAAQDLDMLVTRELFPLRDALAAVQIRYVDQLERTEALAQSFPCA
jgi:sulfatase maturation enzyme AslB (radical SAM superfamily)